MTARAAAFLLAAALLGGCRHAAPEPAPASASPPRVDITLLHLNDVYEIGAVEGGRRGGLARVATLHERLLSENPNTFILHAGDMVSPSAMGTARVDGKRLDGRQMVAVLNLLGLDYATFGNHEFDLDEEAFRARLAESRFQWISANVTGADGRPFPGTSAHVVVPVPDGAGGEVRMGIVGVVLEEGSKPYFRISDPLSAVRREVEALRGNVDILVGLTHLALPQDAELAEAVPELDLILGGHEHENYHLRRGSDMTPVLKGDANARAVFVHRLSFDRVRRELAVESEFVVVDEDLEEDPQVAAEVARWTELAFDGFRADGFDPQAVVATVPVSLDGREASVRNRSTALTDLIARGMLAEVSGAQAAVFNGGSIRIDDVVPPGPLTQYDVIRILPFGGEVASVRMKGSVLVRMLSQGEANVGSGGFLHAAGVARGRSSGLFEIGGEPVEPEGRYVVVLTDFLLTGRETGLGFLTRDNPDIEVLQTGQDVRRVLIDEMQRVYGAPPAP